MKGMVLTIVDGSLKVNMQYGQIRRDGMAYIRDYESDTLSQRDTSSLTRGELEALVTWLRTEKGQRKADLKLALEANVVLCAQVKQLEGDFNIMRLRLDAKMWTIEKLDLPKELDDE